MENNEDGPIPKLDQLLTTTETNNSNNISKITDNIYLGDEEGASDLDFFKKEQIHYVLSIIPTPPKYPEDMKINVMHLNIEDSLKVNIIYYIKQCITFIDNADKIYVHCSCGVNRSAAIIIGYLMWKTHSSYDEVFDYLKKRRECVEPCNLFVIQLHKFQNLLNSNNYNLERIQVKAKIK